MAVEQPGFSIGFMKAAANMANNQFKCVKPTADETFNLCSAAGESFLGVLQDKPAAGSPGNIMRDGVTKVLAGAGGLAAGRNWMTAADGTAIVAADGKIAAGLVLLGAAEGKLASVTVGKQDGTGTTVAAGVVAEAAGKEIQGGSHATTAGEAAANAVVIATGLTTITSAVVTIRDAGNNVVTSDADVTYANGNLTIADGAAYNTVEGQIIEWIVFGVA